MDQLADSVIVVKAKPVRKVFKPSVKVNKIPQSLLNDALLNAAMSALPSNYNFEIHKTIWRIKETASKRVGLQMPEGLLMFATTIADIIEEFTEAETVILGDVTYGACCIDDFSARALDIDFLIHYGHSCLIPINQTEGIKVLYIFVDIKIDVMHCVECLESTLPVNSKVALVSTIQFVGSLHAVATELKTRGYETVIPQSKPLSPGEILGCTAPRVGCADSIVYIGDGRFHLEAALIANPTLKAYKYDPYEKKVTEEYYNHELMQKYRKMAINQSVKAGKFGLLLGTLGRQGSNKVLSNLQDQLKDLNKQNIIILLSEIFPNKLKLFVQVDSFIQVACPRLSIDWGVTFAKPLLNPYEAAVTLSMVNFNDDEPYPMDFYAHSSLGPWTPIHKTSEKDKQTFSSCENCKKRK